MEGFVTFLFLFIDFTGKIPHICRQEAASQSPL